MNTRPTKNNQDQYTQTERSDVARSYIRQFCRILPFYSSPIRAICSAKTILKTEDQARLKEFAISSVLGPVRVSPTLSQTLILAAEEFYPDEYQEIAQGRAPQLKQTLSLLHQNEMAAILGVSYAFKILKKVCNAEEFNNLAPMLSLQLSHGMTIGPQIHESFGRGGGVAAAGIRGLSLYILMQVKPKIFKKLKKLLDLDTELLHESFELEHWGCTHLDIASELAGELGFGHAARSAYIALQDDTFSHLNEESIWWSDCLRECEQMWATGQEAARKNRTQQVVGAGGTSDTLPALDGCRWLWSVVAIEPAAPEPTLEETVEAAPQAILEPRTYAVDETFDASTAPVLIVEDDPIGQKILEKKLTQFSNKTMVTSAEEALALITSQLDAGNPFKLAFLDVSLPQISGIELCKELRRKEGEAAYSALGRCKVLMVTSAEEAETVVDAFTVGADGYVTKPIHSGRLDEELKKIGIRL